MKNQNNNRFTFEENTHQYKLDGKRMTGVTTIIGILDKPQLVAWASNQAVDYVKANADCEKKGVDDFWTYSITESKLDEARTSWAKKRDKAGECGSIVHKAVEEYVKSKIKNEPEPILGLSGISLKMFEKFKEWEKDNDVKFLLSEQKLYSEKYWYAGTCDLVVEIKGKKFIADIKTSSQIFYTNFLQMAGYHIALEELEKIKDIKGYCVINIPKDLKSNGEAKIRTKFLTKNLEQHKQAFKDCLSLYRYVNKSKFDIKTGR